tara:strand:+ start:5331 stop:6866 length:1536 start_codon:yes stop_codon:yes gene_type:complete
VGDYGLSWDETFRFGDADSKLHYYQELLAGNTPKPSSSSYPGFFDLPLAIVHEALPDWGTRSQKGHVWSLCFGLLGLLSAWRLTARIGGERAGFFALLFLSTLPRYYGHMFFNPKDIPLAGTYVFGVWALVALFSRLPQPAWRWVLWIGVAAGLAMSTRIAGFLVLCYFGLFVGLFLLCQLFTHQRKGSDLPQVIVAWALRGAVSGAIGFVILYFFWPTLHQNPWQGASASVATVQSYGWDGMVLMDGHFWEAQNLPVYYIPYWLLYTLPEHIIVLLALGFALGAQKTLAFVKAKRAEEVPSLITRGVLLFSAIFPLLYLLWKDPVLYDGMRHFLFVLPSMACVAALSLEWGTRKMSRFGRKTYQFLLPLAAGLAALIVAIEMISLHPYQYVYFNRISGGLHAAYSRDETDYWGLSHKEAGEWLNQYIDDMDPDSGRVYRVHLRYTRWMLKEALDPQRFEMWQPREGADFFVSVTRFNLHKSYPEATLLHTIEREGVPLCFIYAFPERSAE